MSPTNTVYNDGGCTLYGPQPTQTSPQGKPLSKPPPTFRRINYSHVTPISRPTERPTAPDNRPKATRRGSRTEPYSRPALPPIELPPPPISLPVRSPATSAMDAAIQASINSLNHIGIVYRKTVYKSRLEKEALEKERDLLKEKLRALTLSTSSSSTPSPTMQLKNATAKQFSMAGPIRSSSLSGSSQSNRRPSFRSKSAEPRLTTGGGNDCFDVTIIGYNTIPTQSEWGSTTAGSPDSDLIRDAVHPNAAPRPCPRPAGPGEIDTHHIDIMYIPQGGQLFCRACCVNQELKKSSFVKTFPNNTSWDDLRNHCVTEHPIACQDIANLHPAELYELRRRLRATQSSR